MSTTHYIPGSSGWASQKVNWGSSSAGNGRLRLVVTRTYDQSTNKSTLSFRAYVCSTVLDGPFQVTQGSTIKVNGSTLYTFPQATVEHLACRLYAVARVRGRCLARGQARAAHLGRHVQENRQVRHEAFRHEVVEVLQELHVDAASIALVGERGVGEPVAHHPLAACERRADHLRHHLRARRQEEQHLASRHGRVLHLVAHERADQLRHPRAAWLARHDDFLSLLPEPFGQGLHLSGLAAALRSLERYELSAHGLYSTTLSVRRLDS